MTNKTVDKKISLSIDIGGTFIKFAIINRQGLMLDFWKIPTNLEEKGLYIPKEITNELKNKLKETKFNDFEVIGMGIGIPGFPTLEGKVKFSGNIGWRDYDIIKDLEDDWSIPIFVHNDCDMAALGEKFIGIARDLKNYVFLTLGTGLGSGVVVNGELYQGAGGMAGEFGHIPIQGKNPEYECTCGLKECAEPTFSATGLVKIFEKVKFENPDIPTNVDADGKAIWEGVAAGDKISTWAVEEFSEYGGRILATIAMAYNPEKIILGGGLAHNNYKLLECVKPVYERFVHDFISDVTKIEICHVGNDSALYGAAYTVMKKTNNLIK